MAKRKHLLDEYRFPGFRPQAEIKGIFGDSKARVLQLKRRQKKRFVGAVELFTERSTTIKLGGFEIFLVDPLEFIWKWTFGGCCVGRAGK